MAPFSSSAAESSATASDISVMPIAADFVIKPACRFYGIRLVR